MGTRHVRLVVLKDNKASLYYALASRQECSLVLIHRKTKAKPTKRYIIEQKIPDTIKQKKKSCKVKNATYSCNPTDFLTCLTVQFNPVVTISILNYVNILIFRF